MARSKIVKGTARFLTLGLAMASISCGGSSSSPGISHFSPAKPTTTNANLTSWTLGTTSLLPTTAEFGNVVYDPDAKIWRLFYSAKSAIFSATGTSATSFMNNGKVALAFGPKGSWDTFSMDVPFAWYEAGQARPWRMLYRGGSGSSGSPTSKFQIGLATALPASGGTINWQREDTRGNSLTAPVLPEPTSGWAANQFIDFGSVMKYGGNYYMYYDTIASPREIGLTTSTDLVHWVEYPKNPLFKGVVNTTNANQGPDQHYAGTPAPDQGFFCPDIVYWPNPDSSPRFVLFTPHYGSAGTSYDVFVSNSPVFQQYTRQYIGKVLDTQTQNYSLDGSAADDCDTPRIITDDISRNVVTSTMTGGQVLMVGSIKTREYGWLMTEFSRAR